MHIPRKYQTPVQRLAALLIDSLLFLPVAIVLKQLAGSSSGLSQQFWLFWSGGGLWVLYRALMHSRYGQTLGKMASKLKVLSADEINLLDFGNALLRELPWCMTLLIPTLPEGPVELRFIVLTLPEWIDALVMWRHPKRRALHDLIAGSVVIDTTTYRKWDFEYTEAPASQLSATQPAETATDAAIRIEKFLTVPVARLFSSWTEPGEMLKWFGSDPQGTGLEAEADARSGGSFLVAFRDSDGTVHECFGKYLAVLPPHLLVFTWNWRSEPGPESIVTVRFREEPGGCLLLFEHSGAAAGSAHNYLAGWQSTFEKLQKILADN